MNKQLQIIREVNIAAEDFYYDAVALGDHAADALSKGHRSQLTGLENIAYTALKVSDVLYYIKRQTARFTDWQSSYKKSKQPDVAFGEQLKNYIEVELAKKRNDLCCPKRLNISDQTDEDKFLRQRVYLQLIRQFIRQMVVQYEYNVNFLQSKEGVKK